MAKGKIVAALCALAVLLPGGIALAQDSVSKAQGLPGDAVSVYATAEQVNDYVVDLAKFRTSWGTPFGIAPLVKSSKIQDAYFTGAFSAQAMSRTLRHNVPFARTSYSYWKGQGFGINNDTSLNDPGTPIDTSGYRGHQFAVAFSEFGGNANSVVSALVNYLPNRPNRLYVSRVPAAINGLSLSENRSQLGLGSIDSHGNTYFRADGFGASGPNTILDNNLFRIKTFMRSATSLNMIDNSGGSDSSATDWLVVRSTISHNTPGCAPEGVIGRPMLLSSNFNALYLYESSPGVITTTSDHRIGLADHRGAVAFSPVSISQGGLGDLYSTVGSCAMYGSDGFVTQWLLLWGIKNDGSVVSNVILDPPLSITDNSDGFVFPASAPGNVITDFIHHGSQTAFRGGNGQVAMGQDPNGKVLAATTVVSDELSGLNNPVNAIAVARFDRKDPEGTLEWTVASYTNWPGGKAIKDGPGGNAIGQIVELNLVTGGSPYGPSHSAPVIDGAGNIWLLSSVELYDPEGGPSDFDNALVRAVYNPDTFSYELELVLQLGQVLAGKNSDTNYQIRFLSIADSNSVDSSTLWSGNALAGSLNDMNVRGLETRDPRTLGGLVLWAEIVYDVNRDGDFIKVTGSSGDPLSEDQEYNVLLYVGAYSAGGIGDVH